MGREVNLKLGVIFSCLDCQNHSFTGFYLQVSFQQFNLKKSHLQKLIQKRRTFLKTGQKANPEMVFKVFFSREAEGS